MGPDLSGRVLGGCTLLERLGEGGMGAVYRARQTSLNRFVAVKVLLPELRQSASDFVERFKREAEFLAWLAHPHILPIYDYGEDGDLCYMIMPLMSGGSLAQCLKMTGPLPIAALRTTLAPLAEALDFAHAQGVLHRDLKPHNILFDQHGQVYLGDFGIAVALESRHTLTGSGVTLGTPAYMSPEQARGDALDARSDVYSLGVVVYESVTGALPFEAPTPMGLGLKHMTDPPRPPRQLRPDLPDSVEAALLTALAKRPADRFSSAGELIRALGGGPPAPASTPDGPVSTDNEESAAARPKPILAPSDHAANAAALAAGAGGSVCAYCGRVVQPSPPDGRCPACGHPRLIPRSRSGR